MRTSAKLGLPPAGLVALALAGAGGQPGASRPTTPAQADFARRSPLD